MNKIFALIGFGLTVIGTFYPIYSQLVELNANIAGIQVEIKHDNEKFNEMRSEINRLWDRYNSLVEKEITNKEINLEIKNEAL